MQHRIRDFDIAPQAVVEGQRDLVGEHAAVRDGVGDRAQRHDVEAALEPAQLALEARGLAARGTVNIRMRATGRGSLPVIPAQLVMARGTARSVLRVSIGVCRLWQDSSLYNRRVHGPVYLCEDIRRIESAAGDTKPPLMERAGAAAAQLAATLAGDKAKDVLVLAGPGNNGGDARVVAERLKELFFRVSVATRRDEIPERSWGLVVDGLFGIGLAREIAGEHAALVDYANRQPCPVLALDIPSGIHADTGRVLGCAVRATHTVTFIALKPGLLTLDGPDHCGEIRVETLGLDLPRLHAPTAWVAQPDLFRNLLKPRPRNFHKGKAGSVAILGGAAGHERRRAARRTCGAENGRGPGLCRLARRRTFLWISKTWN